MAARRSRQGANAAPNARATVTTIQTTYSGPLPAPADLERYDAIVPGMAGRLLEKFEQQADHRMALEKHVVHGDVRRANWGLVAGTVFGLAVLVGSVTLILNGHETPGTLALLSTFVTYGGAFLYGSETRRRERNRNAGR